MLIRIYPENPNEKAIAQVVEILQHDGVIIYPTDSVYAFGCSLRSNRAIERLRTLTGKQGNDFSIICADLSGIATYARVDNPVFKLMKRNLPGPFTFLLNASSKVPDKYLERKKTIGVRIPGNAIPVAIVKALGNPLVTASVKTPDNETEYTTDPSLLNDLYGERVDAVIDGGYGHLDPTTVVECTGDEPEIVREGIGELIF